MFAARLGDITFGVCTGHITPISVDGIVIASSSKVFVNGRPVARIGDTVLSSCGHLGTIVSGSSKVFISGIPMARLSDSFTGVYSGTIVSCSGNVFCGG
jgi:uncharacterized Zn-binding protein involved in type VI secretion